MAGAFCAYFGLLIYCDFVRPENPGFTAEQAEDAPGVLVSGVSADSPAERAGLRVGDRIIAFNHVRIPGAESLMWLSTILDLGVAMPVVVERAGTVATLVLRLEPASLDHWRAPTRIILLISRGAQLVTLIAALFVIWRRPRDVTALTGAWFLLTCATFTIAPPMRLASVWQEWPLPLGALLWIPHASSLAIGPVLLTFVAGFPRRMRYGGYVQAVACALAAATLAVPLYNFGHVVYGGDILRATGPGSNPLFALTLACIAASVPIAVWNYRRIEDLNERRRLRIVVAGIATAVLPGFPLVAFYWIAGRVDLQTSIFQSPALAFAAVALLAAPLSITYAVLRHRLFDVSFIIRQWLQYAVARWVAISVAPVLGAVLAIDLLRHRTQTVEAIIERRGMLYILLSATAITAYVSRNRWLDAIDRRFFRERHDGFAVLREVAQHLRRSNTLVQVAPLVVAKIEAAMHPQFAVLLARQDPMPVYRTIAAAPAAHALPDLHADSKLIALARVLDEPIDTSLDADRSEARHFTDADLDYVASGGIELIVPATASDGTLPALLVLGVKRSEEPFSGEERDILVTIAGNLALLAGPAGRSSPQPETPALNECATCGHCFDRDTHVCAHDGQVLSQRGLPRTLAGRYRLDRRLAAGGMGTVYEAYDTALDRQVAAKVIREDLPVAEGVVGRFVAEARSAARLVHPNVVTVYDFGVVDGRQPFLVMERLRGRTLRQELEDTNPMPPEVTMSVLAGVCAAVDAAHRVRLVHRDLKPENIFLVEGKGIPTPKVLDFGVAKALMTSMDATTRSETQPGVLLGTPEYMAPEQLRGEPASTASDLWSLAIIAREMLEPLLRVDAASPSARPSRLTVWHAGEGFQGAWPHVARFFDRALALDHSRRPPDPSAFFAELEYALRADGVFDLRRDKAS